MKEIKDLGFGIIQVNELKPTMSKTKSVDNYLCKWQKLKEIIKKLYVKAEPGGIEHCVTTYIYKKMQELEVEDE